jgi:basic membrane protein A
MRLHLKRRGVSTAVVAVVAAAVIIAAAAAAAIVYVPGLSSNTVTVTKTTTATTSTTPQKQYKLALVLGGDETDAGWNAIGIQAAQYIQAKYGWSVSISRDVAYSDQARVITTYAQGGYDVVWTHGGQFIGTTEGIAKQFPNTYFVMSPTYQQDNLTKNTVALGPDFQVTGYYQAGVLAGRMTKTNGVAVVIGQFYDYISMEFYAFQAGVQSANPSTKVYARVAGTWADPSLGLQIAQTLIQTQHVDIIAQIADATGRGVITAAQQHNVSVIGTVGDQAALAPAITMTSVMMNTTAFIQTVAQHISDGTWSQIGGKVLNMNLGYLGPFHNYDNVVPASVKTLLAQTVAGIGSGTITVPRTVTQNPPPDPT